MNRLTLCVALAAALGMGATVAHADSFTYHGTLQDAGRPANGTYDLQLTLYSKQTGGTVVAGPVNLYNVNVHNGAFSTSVDFGQSSSTAGQGWVDVKVRPAGGQEFLTLDSRSPVEPEGGCPGSWTLDGNAANPGGSYLGTTDANPLQFNVDGTAVAFFYPDATQMYFLTSVGLAYPDLQSGQYSIAAGYNAGSQFTGSFVYAGYGGDYNLGSARDTTTNQFIVYASHGVGINTATAADGSPLRDELTIAPSPDLPATNADLTMLGSPTFNYKGFNFNVQDNGFYQIQGLYDDGGGLFYDSLLFVNYIHGPSPSYAYWSFNGANSFNPITVGTTTSDGNGAFLSGGGVWTNASSRTWKDTFNSIDPVAVLEKLVAMPVSTWYYKGNHDDGQHMGPVAEDFAQAFGLGGNEKYIGTVDESGVAFAAIQGLDKKVKTENEALRNENAALRNQLETLSARMDKLESRKGE